MTGLVRQPTERLRGVVTRIGYTTAEDHPARVEVIMPSARTNLMVDLTGVPFRSYGGHAGPPRVHAGAIAAGPATEPMWILLEPRVTVWADFEPAAARAVFGVPTSELPDVIDLSDLWGSDADGLRDRLASAESPSAALAALEDVLLDHLHPELGSPTMAVAAEALEAGARVGDIAAAVDMSARSLDRCFRSSVGVNPKAYARVRRVQALLGRLSTSTKPGWADLANDLGYYDQAHLINDFRSITGMTPNSYMALVTAAPQPCGKRCDVRFLQYQVDVPAVGSHGREVRMVNNRSAPPGTVVPALVYGDVSSAVAWLSRAFGFREVLRWGPPETPTVQLSVGTDASMVAFGPSVGHGTAEDLEWRPPQPLATSQSLTVQIPDVDAHYEKAVAAGADVLIAPQTYNFGERQYSVLDVGGHVWCFTQSVDDVDPKTWATTPSSS